MKDNIHIENIINNEKYLKEYIILCSNEWGTVKNKVELKEYVKNKIYKIKN